MFGILTVGFITAAIAGFIVGSVIITIGVLLCLTILLAPFGVFFIIVGVGVMIFSPIQGIIEGIKVNNQVKNGGE